MLSLAEELLLLALDDEKGTIPSSAEQPLRYGLPAAAVTDLLLAGRLAIGEKNRVAVVDGTRTGDDILDEIIERIERARKPKSVKDCVVDFGNGSVKKIRERLLERLVERGALRAEEGKYLRLIPWHHYPTVDGALEAETRERLRIVLLADGVPDARTASIISLAAACKLLDRLFPREERKRVEARAKEISKGQVAGEAVSKAAAEAAAASAAVIAAVAAATITSTTSSSSG